MLPRLLDYILKRRRTFEVDAFRFAMIGVSTGRGPESHYFPVFLTAAKSG